MRQQFIHRQARLGPFDGGMMYYEYIMRLQLARYYSLLFVEKVAPAQIVSDITA